MMPQLMTAVTYDHNFGPNYSHMSRATYIHFRMDKKDIQQKRLIGSGASSGTVGKKVSLWQAELYSVTEA